MWAGLLALAACTPRGDHAVIVMPRQAHSFVLETVQQAVREFEPLYTETCAGPSVQACRRAEAIRAHLLFAQAQLTRLLGASANGQQPPIPIPVPVPSP